MPAHEADSSLGSSQTNLAHSREHPPACLVSSLARSLARTHALARTHDTCQSGLLNLNYSVVVLLQDRRRR
jgi:hypothetical protein